MDKQQEIDYAFNKIFTKAKNLRQENNASMAIAAGASILTMLITFFVTKEVTGADLVPHYNHKPRFTELAYPGLFLGAFIGYLSKKILFNSAVQSKELIETLEKDIKENTSLMNDEVSVFNRFEQESFKKAFKVCCENITKYQVMDESYINGIKHVYGFSD